jgi:hypothetical protein
MFYKKMRSASFWAIFLQNHQVALIDGSRVAQSRQAWTLAKSIFEISFLPNHT